MTVAAPAPRSVATRVRQLREAGSDVLGAAPRPEQLARKSPARRREILDELRVDLYALSSLVADAAVDRARRHRPAYPPLGLARSGYSATRMVVAEPEPFPEGSITDFQALGKAFVDTTVFHLYATWQEQRHSAPWLLDHLEDLLSLFRDAAGPAGEARMRDGISFLYGGLHFGTGVSVQLVEVMTKLLEADGRLDIDQRVEVLKRSSRPALRLAALNVDQIVGAFQGLQAGGDRAGWMVPERFHLVQPDDGPARIDLQEGALAGEEPSEGASPTSSYTTLGCPARVAAGDSGLSAIAGLWTWSIELARDTGLLGARQS